MKKPTISVIGLGYVGLPVSIAFDEAGYNVIGFDLNRERIDQLVNYIDKTNEINEKRLLKSKVKFTVDEKLVDFESLIIVNFLEL